jgi:UDP-N-acetylglucosamine/UDP-N-acetyl-alpha-D-glucosaminouronate 4-epimerase
MSRFAETCAHLRAEPRRFLVTGAAGFIGSHLTERLLCLGQRVVGLDNFATGTHENLSAILSSLCADERARFRFIEGDIRNPRTCADAVTGAQVVLHQAALASVPRSMKDPLGTHSTNVDGFVNVLLAAQAAGVERVVYASSSSVYGDDAAQPKTEARIGRPLSPYAATKLIDEVYAGTFQRTHGIRSVGLRYFNVFGPRQDPDGPYAAVIPRWVENLLRDEPCVVFGDGSASRDFCFVDNVVQANLLAACAPERTDAAVFNIACGARMTLLELFAVIRAGVLRYQPNAETAKLQLAPPRPGDIPHSFASVERAREALGYEPSHDVVRGMSDTIAWYAPRVLEPRGRTRVA